MRNEMLQGVSVLVPLMRMHEEIGQADLVEFAQVYWDETQFTTYQSLGQAMKDQQADRKHTISHLIQIQKMVR